MMLYGVYGISWGHVECGKPGQDLELLCAAWQYRDHRQATS